MEGRRLRSGSRLKLPGKGQRSRLLQRKKPKKKKRQSGKLRNGKRLKLTREKRRTRRLQQRKKPRRKKRQQWLRLKIGRSLTLMLSTMIRGRAVSFVKNVIQWSETRESH